MKQREAYQGKELLCSFQTLVSTAPSTHSPPAGQDPTWACSFRVLHLSGYILGTKADGGLSFALTIVVQLGAAQVT